MRRRAPKAAKIRKKITLVALAPTWDMTYASRAARANMRTMMMRLKVLFTNDPFAVYEISA